jgi:hypothetical protein
MKNTAFCDVTHCSLIEVYQHFEVASCLPHQDYSKLYKQKTVLSLPSSQIPYSFALKMNVAWSFEVLIKFCHITQHYIPAATALLDDRMTVELSEK